VWMVTNGASEIAHRSGQRQIWLRELSQLTWQKGDPRNPNHCGINAKPAAAAARALASVV